MISLPSTENLLLQNPRVLYPKVRQTLVLDGQHPLTFLAGPTNDIAIRQIWISHLVDRMLQLGYSGNFYVPSLLGADLGDYTEEIILKEISDYSLAYNRSQAYVYWQPSSTQKFDVIGFMSVFSKLEQQRQKNGSPLTAFIGTEDKTTLLRSLLVHEISLFDTLDSMAEALVALPGMK